MNQHSTHFSLSACALAVALLLSACGGAETTDTVPPTVAITDNVPGATATGPVTFTFTFSEDVGSSFAAEDITVTGGTAGALTKVHADHYTLVVTPPASSTGTINVSVAAGMFKDLALNDNTEMATASQAFDTTTAPPVGAGTVVADFDTVVPVVRDPDSGGTGFITTTDIPAGGGTGAVLGVLRSGGQPWALNVLEATFQFAADRKTLSAKVYSPTAGIRMVMKVEGPGGAIEVDANETVAVGWQTLTWTYSAAKTDAGAYNLLVILPNLGVVDEAPGKTYYFDDITVLPAPVAPPAGTATVVADFDTVVPVVRDPDSGGTGFITTTDIPAGGGTGAVLGVLRSGGQPWALNVLEATFQFAADRKTLSAKVYSPTAGIRMVMKVEGPGGAIEVDANEAVTVGWQTLTWTYSAANTGAGAYNLLVILPNLGVVDEAPGKTYYFDDITVLPAAVAPPAGTDTVVADFDTVFPVVRDPDSGGTGFITDTDIPAGGGTGAVLGVLRSGGQPWALNVLEAPVQFAADRKTLSAKVYSPTAGIRMVMKVEGTGGAVEVDANETVAVGWQTLTWNFSAAKADVGAYNLLVILPNLGVVDEAPGKTYYFDDIKVLAAAGGGGGGGGGTTPPGARHGLRRPADTDRRDRRCQDRRWRQHHVCCGRRAVCGELRGQRRAKPTTQPGGMAERKNGELRQHHRDFGWRHWLLPGRCELEQLQPEGR
jgi:hypothetical protein